MALTRWKSLTEARFSGFNGGALSNISCALPKCDSLMVFHQVRKSLDINVGNAMNLPRMFNTIHIFFARYLNLSELRNGVSMKATKYVSIKSSKRGAIPGNDRALFIAAEVMQHLSNTNSTRFNQGEFLCPSRKCLCVHSNISFKPFTQIFW